MHYLLADCVTFHSTDRQKLLGDSIKESGRSPKKSQVQSDILLDEEGILVFFGLNKAKSIINE